MSITSPSSLQTLAEKASFKHILGLFIPCKTSTSAEIVARQNAIRQWLSNRLDDHFTRDEGNRMRLSYIKQFRQEVKVGILLEIWMFLDVVLNSSFKHLHIHGRLSSRFQPDSRLVPVVAQRCPHLESLILDFFYHDQPHPELDQVKQVIWSLRSLGNLSSLCLFLNTPENPTSLVKVFGKSCPILSTFSWDYLYTAEKRDVLALVLGELVVDPDLKDREAEWSADDVLQSLCVPPDCVTPFCSTLQHLDLGPHCSPASIAFLLRHMPLLQTVDEARDNLAKGILIFQNAPILEGIQKEFDALCIQGASRLDQCPLDPDHPVSNLIPLPSSSFLSLTKLDSISLLDEDVLRAIGSVCTSLKNVTFCQHPDFFTLNIHINFEDDNYAPPMMPISLEELESILCQWSKLEIIRLSRVHPEVVKSILKVFGPGKLQELTLDHCGGTVLADLTPCSKVERLTVYRGWYRSQSESKSAPNNFISDEKILPNLIYIDEQ